MENTKFANFGYRLIESNVADHKAVEVSYEFNGKPAKRFIFIKEKPGTDYLATAKEIIAKDMKNGRLEKISKKYFGGRISKKVKVALATALCAGAITFSGLYTYIHFQSTNQQESVASVEKVVELVKELNPSSLEEEIKAANDAYNNLSDQEKSLVSANVVLRLEEQTRLFNQDKEDANNLDASTAILEEEVLPLPREIRAARSAYKIVDEGRQPSNNKERRIKLLQYHDLAHYDEIISKAEKELEDSHDEEISNMFILRVEGIYKKETTDKSTEESEITACRIDYVTNILAYPRRVAIIDEPIPELDNKPCLVVLDEIKAAIEKDKQAVNEYVDIADALFAKLETCNKEEITAVEQARVTLGIDRINRKFLVGLIANADDCVKQAKREYNLDEATVNEFALRVNSLNPEFCTEAEIEIVKTFKDNNEVEEKANRRQGELLEIYQTANATLTKVDGEFQYDKQLVVLLEASIDAAEKSGSYQAFSKELINGYFNECEYLMNNRPGHRSDLRSRITGCQLKINAWISQYDDDAKKVNNFVIKTQELQTKEGTSSKCTKADIDEVRPLYNQAILVIRTDLIDTVNEYRYIFEIIEESYQKDYQRVNSFNEQIELMVNDASERTKDIIDACIVDRSYIDSNVHRSDLINGEYRENCVILDAFNQQWEEYNKEVELFVNGNPTAGINGVKQLVEQEQAYHSCTDSLIKQYEKEYAELAEKIKNGDLASKLLNAKTNGIDYVRNAYNMDLDSINVISDEIDELGRRQLIDIGESDIVNLENKINEMLNLIKRTDLIDKINKTVSPKLAAIRKDFDYDKTESTVPAELVADMKDKNYSIYKCSTFLSFYDTWITQGGKLYTPRQKKLIEELGLTREVLDPIVAEVENEYGEIYNIHNEDTQMGTFIDSARSRFEKGFTLEDTYGQTFNYGQNIFDNCKYPAAEYRLLKSTNLSTSTYSIDLPILAIPGTAVEDLFKNYSEIIFKYTAFEKLGFNISSISIKLTTEEDKEIDSFYFRANYPEAFTEAIVLTKEKFESIVDPAHDYVVMAMHAYDIHGETIKIGLSSIYGKKSHN